MTYTMEFDINTFPFWSGAKDTIEDIKRVEKMDELANLIEGIFCDCSPTDTQINDYVWFERDEIFETLGIEN